MKCVLGDSNFFICFDGICLGVESFVILDVLIVVGGFLGGGEGYMGGM